uniref:SHSP domain-containing protein n=1 Tax=Acrobeloides nanus TaxID=290746 RepID=A0A914C0B1_9BILA
MADSDSAQTRKLSDDDSAFARRKSSEVARDIEVKYDWTGTIGQWKLSEQRTPNYNDVLTVSHTPYGWDISLNVAPFKPNEIHTYILKNELIVDCRHENRNDEIGSLSREMQRVIKIPGDVHAPSIAIFMYPSGLLTIKGTKGINHNH